jgi:hypothetical protein
MECGESSIPYKDLARAGTAGKAKKEELVPVGDSLGI